MNEHAAPHPSRATYQDVLDAPDHMVAEIARGALHLSPRPAPRHATASFALAGRLYDPFGRGVDGPGGWLLAMEPELHLGDDVLVPDLAGCRRDRLPTVPDTAWIELAPDWACEILSPSTRRFDTTDKRALYAANAVRHLWFVDPDERTLETFELRDGLWALLSAQKDEDAVRCPPFDAIVFPLDALWPD